MITFMKEGVMAPREDGHHKSLLDPLPNNKTPTFLTLYEVKKKDTETCAAIKDDRNTLPRIVIAMLVED